jgi:hypothetical protein
MDISKAMGVIFENAYSEMYVEVKRKEEVYALYLQTKIYDKERNRYFPQQLFLGEEDNEKKTLEYYLIFNEYIAKAKDLKSTTMSKLFDIHYMVID